ncbi:MAG: hypothetical protein ILO42_00255 [Clostridia bacterium]|nr:hypothetical protein [Clostridia bacterium]
MNIAEIIKAVPEIASVVGLAISVAVAIRKVFAGQRCLLRSEMLRIYYHNRDKAEIRQYEYENFVMLYEAYKKLKGNSFIDKIYEEVRKWKVIT